MLKKKLKDHALSRKVRYGKCGTPPDVLTDFIKAASRAAESMPREQCRQVHIEMLELIRETVCDSLIARCWRGWCLDHSYIPLAKVRQLSWTESEKRELMQLEKEMRFLSRYFLP
ncbi:MAG: hypothetical protein AAF197_04875 [Pseudomonadota bacterium]